MRNLSVVLKIIFLALFSAASFLLIESIFEFIWANWISDKPAWPDQRSIYSLLRVGFYQAVIFTIAFIIGSFLSLSNIRGLSSFKSLLLVVICALIGSISTLILSNIEFESAEVSFLIVLFWPILILVSVAILSRVLIKER